MGSTSGAHLLVDFFFCSHPLPSSIPPSFLLGPEFESPVFAMQDAKKNYEKKIPTAPLTTKGRTEQQRRQKRGETRRPLQKECEKECEKEIEVGNTNTSTSVLMHNSQDNTLKGSEEIHAF
jgi:hypothetical protein